MKRDFFSIGVYLTALVALLDQASKWWVLNDLLAGARFVRVNAFLNLRLSLNRGVTFGLFDHEEAWMPYILIGVATLILLLLLDWLRKAETLYAGFGLGLVMGGAIGNVIDRFRFGAVVDFLDFHILDYHWYTFNLADSAIVAGVALLLLENILARRQKLKG